MLYAVVDIETTGGYAGGNGITEIAIRISDGKKVLRSYDTLLNPVYSIPRYVQGLTGITDEMVAGQRHFAEAAQEIYELLHDKIFVAHNVNFDYSFLHHHLKEAGYDLSCKKLCTIRLARQVLPGHRRYSLGTFCEAIGIPIEQRHRAGGDADATVKLLHHLIDNDLNDCLGKMLKGTSKEQYLPPNLPAHYVKGLPHQPGVYYFHDSKGKIIYVGKARDLSKRVHSHFSNNKANKQKQEFLRNIHSISFKTTATELMAFILESVEIRKLWPQENRSQKRFQHSYALYAFHDANGFMRLGIEKKHKTLPALYTFNLLTEGHNLLRKLTHQFSLCPKLCFLQQPHAECSGKDDGRCDGACDSAVDATSYNSRVIECIAFLNKELPTFALMDEGLQTHEQSCILMEKGRFVGMGYIPKNVTTTTIDDLRNYITPYPENDYIRGLVFQHINMFPEKKRDIPLA
jgi:DNA polymerase III subunit epsilon